jgi:hypothetical protein
VDEVRDGSENVKRDRRVSAEHLVRQALEDRLRE